MEVLVRRFACSITASVLVLATTNVPAAMDVEMKEKAFINNMNRYTEFCEGAYAGKVITQTQLKTVSDLHQVWLRAYDTEEKQDFYDAKNDTRRANLCDADLRRANLSGVNLSGASLVRVNLSGTWQEEVNLSAANLSGAKLSGANLIRVDLSGANLSYANLSGTRLSDTSLFRAYLQNSNLSGAYLYEENLSRADLRGANLSGSSLRYAIFNSTDLRGTDLSEAEMEGADLGGALFEPKELPSIDDIVTALNLDQMVYIENPQALIKLRKTFKEAGYHKQERAITSAIKLSEQWRNGTVWDKVESVFKYVFFDLPTQWGMYPGRALRWLGVFIVVFSFPYIFTLRYPGYGIIYRKWGAENQPVAAGALRSKNRPASSTKVVIEPLQYPWGKAIRRGLQFSLLSAFQIGFREFNVGNWVSRLQSRDYTLYATGWVRSVAGAQALISVYLLAMWALTYFGRPFE